MKKAFVYLKENPVITLLGVMIAILIIFIIIMITGLSPKQKTFSAGPAELIISDQAPAISAPAGTITFCFQLDGRQDGHLPALMGLDAQNVYPNSLSGYNWALLPTSTGLEPFGVLADGTIFAKAAFLQNYGMVSAVYIKADITGWQPVLMVPGTVNGEPAYIYRQN